MKKLITSFALFSLFGIWQVFANAENLRPSVDFSSETDLCDDISADLIIMTGSEASELVNVNSDCSNIGCTDSLACNYNPDVTADDGSCVYPDDYYDCLGNCINDTDADGICDELEVSGCTDPEALNYNPSATDDDTSCEYALQLSIAEIQGMTNVSPYGGQIVETSGIVTAVAPSGYFIQDSGQTWSGIYVYDNTNIPETGDEITVQAEVAEYYEMTELTEVSLFSIHSSGNILDVIQINTGIIEAHEGCLIQAWVTCIEANNEHGEALLQEDSSNDNIVSNDFIYLYDFEVDMSYSIVGVVEYSFGEYKINPRNTLDVQQPWAVSDFYSSKTSIKMVNNFVEIESSIRGEQDFVIYNIVGDVVMNGVFDGSISIPMHRFEAATYLIRVEDSNGLSTTHKLINQ